MAMRLETRRLVLREYTPADYAIIHEILSDEETMRHYPHPFSPEETSAWIARNIDRCARDSFGLWAVELRDSGLLIGDCGITMQSINGQLLPEIGYHISRKHQNHGYATEAAAACMKYAFEELGFERVYSYMKYTNIPSARVAEKNGMRFIEEYSDPANTLTKVYAISREEWANSPNSIS